MNRKTPRQKVLMLQGGGALGAYECGAYKALEEKGLRFDAVVGVSIGAFNGALIAGNKEGNRVDALERFWQAAGVSLPYIPHETFRRHASALYSLAFGNPGLFVPRWLTPWASLRSRAGWTSFYDPRPMKRLLETHVDFGQLARKETRLFLAAVNVETGKMKLFDSFREQITPDHVLASGSLPPGFPSTTIDGKAYWDGALVSNTPLRDVLELLVVECDPKAQAEVPPFEVYLVDLFPREGPLPASIGEVLERSKDIMYSAKIESDVQQCQVMAQTFGLIEELLSNVPEEEARRVRQDPRFHDALCHICPVDVIRISHVGEGKEEFHFKDYDFSHQTIREHIEAGYRDALAALEERDSG